MEIVLMNDDAIIPTRASKRSAGLDLYSSIDARIEVGSIKKTNTGICVSLPENSYGSMRDKSSLAAKGLLTLGEVIDTDYTGEIIVVMNSLIEPIKIKKGQIKKAQLIVSDIIYPEIKLVKSLKDTERNDKGFGKMDISKYLILLVIIKEYKYGRFYYLIKHVRSSIVIDNECFLCFNKYKIVGKGLGKV